MPDLRIQIKSIYDHPEDSDGLRVYVEKRKPARRRWDSLKIGRQEPDLAPSADVQRRLTHDPDQWKHFRDAYEQELFKNPEAQAILNDLRKIAHEHTITLLYDGLDSKHNIARVIEEMVEMRHSHKPRAENGGF